MGFAAEMERSQASIRTASKFRQKAEAGHVTGGRCHGYDNVDGQGVTGKRHHVVRQINEAAVVRRIFTLIAEGAGFKRVAKTLNADGGPAPAGAGDERLIARAWSWRWSSSGASRAPIGAGVSEQERAQAATAKQHLLDAVKRGPRQRRAPARGGPREPAGTRAHPRVGAARPRARGRGEGPGGALQRELVDRVSDLRGLLGRHVGETRQILRRPLVGRLECEPFDDGERRGYRILGEGSYAGIPPTSLAPLKVVTPAGFEPAISTLKGSRPGPG
jgi:hypothetical protein